MESLWQDLKYGARQLARNPGFTAVAVLTLALGIGATTAIFSVVNQVLLRSLPYETPARLVLLWGDVPSRGEHRTQVSATDVADWRSQNSVFEEVATFGTWSATLSGAGDPERLPGMQVGDGYFSVMRGRPLLGRVFTPEEQEDGKDYVLVLGYRLWQSRFGGARDVIGKKVYMSARPYTIVGVMPEDFEPLPPSLVGNSAQFYRPVAEVYNEDDRGSRHLRAIARLKPDVSVQQAQSEMSLIAQRLAEQHPEFNTGYEVRVMTLSEDTVGPARLPLTLLLSAVFFVLLIAGANIGNLLLARAAARQREMAVRAALGAGRGRLVRQLMAENLLLALIGGGLGLGLAVWGTDLTVSLGNAFHSGLTGVAIDLRVLAFTLLLSLLMGVLFGFGLAAQLSRANLNKWLKEGGRSTSGSAGQQRMRSSLIVAEITMAVVLLIAAGLMIRSIARLQQASPGFNTENLLTMNVWLPQAKYSQSSQWVAFYDQVADRIQALPGVESAGYTSVLPISRNFDQRSFQVETHPVPRGQEPQADTYVVTPGYLRTMQIPVLQGREITGQDVAASEPVALVSETFARRYWPAEDPLGKRIRFPGSATRPQPWRTIVGVVRDVKQYGVDKESTMQLYLPEAQVPVSWLTLVVRTSEEPLAVLGAVRGEIRAVDPDQAVFEIATMDSLLRDSISRRRFVMLLLVAFAGLALLLASIGLYGVTAYMVARRSSEIGIRMALGAQASAVLRLVIGQGMRLALAGVALGLAIAVALTRLMEGLLFGIGATDPATFVGISALLVATTLLACWVPARRATRVDPMVALRCE